jgi:tRNA-dihydrouridine synthase B
LGLSLITVHGRTRMQFYKGRADWRAVAAVRAATRLPLIINGDIDSVETAQAALKASGADGVMVGRAALGRPWLVGEIGAALAGCAYAPPDGQTMREAALYHYESLIETMGADVGVRHARKHVAAYAAEAERLGTQIPSDTKAMVLQSPDPHVVRAFLAALFTHGTAPHAQPAFAV